LNLACRMRNYRRDFMKPEKKYVEVNASHASLIKLIFDFINENKLDEDICSCEKCGEWHLTHDTTPFYKFYAGANAVVSEASEPSNNLVGIRTEPGWTLQKVFVCNDCIPNMFPSEYRRLCKSHGFSYWLRHFDPITHYGDFDRYFRCLTGYDVHPNPRKEKRVTYVHPDLCDRPISNVKRVISYSVDNSKPFYYDFPHTISFQKKLKKAVSNGDEKKIHRIRLMMFFKRYDPARVHNVDRIMTEARIGCTKRLFKKVSSHLLANVFLYTTPIGKAKDLWDKLGNQYNDRFLVYTTFQRMAYPGREHHGVYQKYGKPYKPTDYIRDIHQSISYRLPMHPMHRIAALIIQNAFRCGWNSLRAMEDLVEEE